MGGPQVVVLDTHAWIWWVSNPGKLSDAARGRIERAAKDKAICISSISAWEVAMMVARGRLMLSMEVNDWVAKSEALPFLYFVPVTNGIAVRSVNLPGKFHPDPADRIIAATAMMQGGTPVDCKKALKNAKYIVI